jgi:hypothetical protein
LNANITNYILCRVIAIAAWRLGGIVEHRTGTLPTYDPTWYAPITILLSMLEVHIASICASVPIFWPVVTEKWDKIFVTQEIKITTEERLVIDDETQLTRDPTLSRSGSDLELGTPSGPIQVSPRSPGKQESFYKESFALGQVDPMGGVRVQIGTGQAAPVRPPPRAPSRASRDESRKWTKI